MTVYQHKLRELHRDESGVTLVEFGMIAPVLMMMLMGVFDIGYSAYMRSVLDGAVQKSARDSSLETGPNSLGAIDDKIEEFIKAINRDAILEFDRRSYFEFSDVARAELLTDSNSNGECDAGETFEDENGNDTWDEDVGDTGIGGPKDVVLYTVRVKYDRIFPLYGFINVPRQNVLTARTVIKNQPYGQQNANTTPTTTGVCT